MAEIYPEGLRREMGRGRRPRVGDGSSSWDVAEIEPRSRLMIEDGEGGVCQVRAGAAEAEAGKLSIERVPPTQRESAA